MCKKQKARSRPRDGDQAGKLILRSENPSVDGRKHWASEMPLFVTRFLTELDIGLGTWGY
jgi:hypothetical protein